MPAVPGPLAPPQPSIIFGNPQRRRDDDDAGVSLPAIAKAKRGESSSEGGTLSAVGRTTVTKGYKEGASTIWVTSAMELFGPLVELIKVDGKYTLQFLPNAAPQTVQLGSHSPCVNVERVLNNQLFLTPISVKAGGSENDVMVFGTCGPAGRTGLASRVKKPGQGAPRVDMAALEAEIVALESLGIDTGTARKRAAAIDNQGGVKSEQEREAEETAQHADACFWDGMGYEKSDDPVKIFYLAIFDSRAQCGLEARLAYTEAARLFGRCIDLDSLEFSYRAKRCAALCKMRMFQRAKQDAHDYVNNRPESPTGHCLKGIVYDGLDEYNESIACLQKAQEIAEIIPYDRSRVWSTGTIVADSLRHAIERRSQVAERARVANQHGVKYRSLGEYGKAVQCLKEASELQMGCVGDKHLHFATCLNNLGACMEAMGNYADAMQQYKSSLAICELASPGMLRVYVTSGRHLPHVMKGGSLVNGKWVESEESWSCDTYVEVEMVEGEDLSRTSNAVSTQVVERNYQPTFQKGLNIQSPRGDRSVVVRFMGRNPQRVAFLNAARERRRRIQGPPGLIWEEIAGEKVTSSTEIHDAALAAALQHKLDFSAEEVDKFQVSKLTYDCYICVGEKYYRPCKEPIRELKELRGLLNDLEARMKRLKEIGRAKVKELDRVTRQHARELERVEPLDLLIQKLEREERELMQRSQGLEDRIIGQFVFNIEKLSTALEGNHQASIKEWIETPDLDGTRVRGEDYGVTALQVELIWFPECSEYATRICNIGNLFRIFGDRLSRTGRVCDEYKKVEQNYAEAERHLEASREAMKRALSIPQQRTLSLLEAARAEQKGQDSTQAVAEARDGMRTPEYCIVLENLALLSHSRGLDIKFPKGTPESTKATFAANQEKNRRQAVELLEQVMQLRSDLPSLGGAETEEYLRLLRILSQFHAENKNYPDAAVVQDRALHLVKKLYGDKSNEAAKDMDIMCQLHLRLGDAKVVDGDHGSWVIDTSESWHWDMVSRVKEKVSKATVSSKDFFSREAKMLQAHEDAMLKESTRIKNPPPITDYSDLRDEDPLLARAKAESERRSKKKGVLGDVKVTRAVASKLRAPAVELVRMDLQRWPKKELHTTNS